MTLDQKIQIWNAIGTWVAGLATVAAVLVALYLASRSDKLSLKFDVGLRKILHPLVKPSEEWICFEITNLGLNPVTILSLGWFIGKGKKRKCLQQMISPNYSTSLPSELTHGKQGTFVISLTESPDWISKFLDSLDPKQFDNDLKNIRAYAYTSVGKVVEVHPESALISRLRNTRTAAKPNLQPSV